MSEKECSTCGVPVEDRPKNRNCNKCTESRREDYFPGWKSKGENSSLKWEAPCKRCVYYDENIKCGTKEGKYRLKNHWMCFEQRTCGNCGWHKDFPYDDKIKPCENSGKIYCPVFNGVIPKDTRAWKEVDPNEPCSWKPMDQCERCNGSRFVKLKNDYQIACWNCLHSNREYMKKDSGKFWCNKLDKPVYARSDAEQCDRFSVRTLLPCPDCQGEKQ